MCWQNPSASLPQTTTIFSSMSSMPSKPILILWWLLIIFATIPTFILLTICSNHDLYSQNLHPSQSIPSFSISKPNFEWLSAFKYEIPDPNSLVFALFKNQYPVLSSPIFVHPITLTDNSDYGQPLLYSLKQGN
jgi:hypothetical protein